MSYIENDLLSNEKIVCFARPHWIVFAMPMILLLVTFTLSIYAPRLFPGYFPFLNLRMASVVILICVCAVIFAFISAFILYATSEYGITNKRIMIKTGWISRNSLELFLDKVEAIHVDQSVLGRILNYGILRVIGTGGTQDQFPYVPNPLRFRKTAQQQVDMEESKRYPKQ